MNKRAYEVAGWVAFGVGIVMVSPWLMLAVAGAVLIRHATKQDTPTADVHIVLKTESDAEADVPDFHTYHLN